MPTEQQAPALIGVDLLLRRLLQLGIADFLLISAFDIHLYLEPVIAITPI